jgi:hypothetical protein
LGEKPWTITRTDEQQNDERDSYKELKN